MAPAPNPGEKHRRKPRKLRVAELAAAKEAHDGAREMLRRVVSSSSWTATPLGRRLEHVTLELDELSADAESAMVDVDAIDRLAAKLLMLRHAVVRAKPVAEPARTFVTKG